LSDFLRSPILKFFFVNSCSKQSLQGYLVLHRVLPKRDWRYFCRNFDKSSADY